MMCKNINRSSNMFQNFFNFFTLLMMTVAVMRAAVLHETISKYGFSFFSADILIYSAYFSSLLNNYRSLTLVSRKKFKVLYKNSLTMLIIDLNIFTICLTIWIGEKKKKINYDFLHSFVLLLCQLLIVLFSRIKYITNLGELCLPFGKSIGAIRDSFSKQQRRITLRNPTGLYSTNEINANEEIRIGEESESISIDDERHTREGIQAVENDITEAGEEESQSATREIFTVKEKSKHILKEARTRIVSQPHKIDEIYTKVKESGAVEKNEAHTRKKESQKTIENETSIRETTSQVPEKVFCTKQEESQATPIEAITDVGETRMGKEESQAAEIEARTGEKELQAAEEARTGERNSQATEVEARTGEESKVVEEALTGERDSQAAEIEACTGEESRATEVLTVEKDSKVAEVAHTGEEESQVAEEARTGKKDSQAVEIEARTGDESLATEEARTVEKESQAAEENCAGEKDLQVTVDGTHLGNDESQKKIMDFRSVLYRNIRNLYRNIRNFTSSNYFPIILMGMLSLICDFIGKFMLEMNISTVTLYLLYLNLVLLAFLEWIVAIAKYIPLNRFLILKVMEYGNAIILFVFSLPSVYYIFGETYKSKPTKYLDLYHQFTFENVVSIVLFVLLFSHFVWLLNKILQNNHDYDETWIHKIIRLVRKPLWKRLL